MKNIFGYVRVSSLDQNEDRQLLVMKEKKIPKRNIYIDKQSGANFERPQYKKLIRRLKKGDLLYIMSIDRLGRNYEEIQNQWKILTKEKQVEINVIDMPLLNTSSDKDLMGTFIADIVLQILSFVAENERESIHRRQREGIEAAKARGVKFGRPKMEETIYFESSYQLWKKKQISGRKAANMAKMSYSTFYRRCQERIEEEALSRLGE